MKNIWETQAQENKHYEILWTEQSNKTIRHGFLQQRKQGWSSRNGANINTSADIMLSPVAYAETFHGGGVHSAA